MNSNETEILLKFNPNGLIYFKKLFLLFKPIIQKELLYVVLEPEAKNVIFLGNIINDSRFYGYLQFLDEQFIDELIFSKIPTNSSYMLEIQDASLLLKFVKSFTENASCFSMHIEENLTLIYSEGSEIRTRLLNFKPKDSAFLKEFRFPIQIAFMGKIPTKDFIKMTDFVIRTDVELTIYIRGSKNPNLANGYLMDLALETKGGQGSMFVAIKGVQCKVLSSWLELNPGCFEKSFVFDKTLCRILQNITNIEETCILGVSSLGDLVVKFLKESEENMGKMYEMCFLVPYYSDMEGENIKEEINVKEENEEEKETFSDESNKKNKENIY